MNAFDEEDFLSFISTKQSLDKSSIKVCKTRLGVFVAWLNHREIDKRAIEDFLQYLEEKGLKHNSINSYIFFLRHLKEYLKDRDLPYNFLEGIKSYKKNQPEIIIFTLEEIEKIINTHLSYGNRNGQNCSSLDFVYLTLTKFLAKTGCRPEEAFGLKVKFFDVSAGKVQFVDTKIDKNRTNYIFGDLLDELELLIKDKNPEDFVFTNSLNKKINAQTFRDDLKRRAKVAGIINKRIFPYNFRHSYITHELEADVPIQVVADLVGHADIQTTYKNYMHLADQTRRKAAMRHPLVMRVIEPKEVIKQIKENIEGFHLEEDKERFNYSIQETEKGLRFEIEFK